MAEKHPPEFYKQAKAKALELMAEGLSCRAIAREVGVGKSSISTWAQEAGHEWGRINAANAAKANAAYGSERRAGQVLVLAERLDGITDRMVQKHLAFSFGGRDNVYTEHELDRPDAKTMREYAGAISLLVTAMKNLHTFDAAGSEDLTDVQRYLAMQKGERP